MKTPLLLLTSVFITLCSKSQNVNDWKQMKLKGKVKSLKNQWTYRYKKDGVNFTPWEKQHATIYQFNNAGRYTEYREVQADGTQKYKILYTYNLAEKKGEQAYFGKDDLPTIKKTMIYDDKGRITEEIEYSKENKKDRSYTFVYDAYGNNTERIYYKTDGTVGSKTIWMYDYNGFQVDHKLETPGYANSYQKYVVDSKGNRVEETWFDHNHNQTFRFVRVFDANGNQIEEKKYDKTDQLKDVSTWKYEYDKQGNWTKRTQFSKDGIDFSVDERMIVYY